VRKQAQAERSSEALQLSRLHVLSKTRKVTRSIANGITIVDEVKELGTYKSSIDFGGGNVAEMEFEVVGE
jgi:hypothetical protein